MLYQFMRLRPYPRTCNQFTMLRAFQNRLASRVSRLVEFVGASSVGERQLGFDHRFQFPCIDESCDFRQQRRTGVRSRESRAHTLPQAGQAAVGRARLLSTARTPSKRQWCCAVKRPNEDSAQLFWARVQFVEYALQLFQLLPSLAEFALRRQALIVGKVFGGFGDERVQISCR